MLHLRWPEIADADLDHYEVRRGTTWTLGEQVYAGPLANAVVENNWATEGYLVRARNVGGRTSGKTATVSVASALPNGWTAATGFPRDEAALPWTGTHSSTTTSGSYLVLSSTALAGTYTTATIDTGSSAKRRWTGYMDAALVDATLTWADCDFTWDSPAGQERTWDGAEPVGTSGGVDLETTWADLTGTWDDYANRTWDGQIGALGQDGLARLEAAFSDNGSDFTAWGVMRPHYRKARYVKFRVKLARRTTGFTVQVRALYFHAASDDVWTASATPSGAAGGDLGGTYPNPTVRQLTTSTPDTLPIGPIAEGGVLVRTSSTITTVPSTTWIVAAADQVLTTHIAADQVTDAKLRNSGALSVIGRSANSTGDPADISASAASGAVLRESASVLGFGTVATAGIADKAVTLAKMADMATDKILGRDTAGTGVPEALAVSNGLEFSGSGGIQRSALTGDVTASAGSNATTIANDAVTTAKILNANVTLAKIANGTACSLLGRSANSSGVYADVALTEGHHPVRRSNVVVSEELNLANVWTPSNESVFFCEWDMNAPGHYSYNGTGGSDFSYDGEAGHPGIRMLSSGSSSGGSSGIVSTNKCEVLQATTTFETLTRLMFDATTGTKIQIGFSDNRSGTADPANGVFFEYLKGTSANWRYRTANASTYTTGTSSTAVAFSSWIKFKITYDGTTVTFYVNGSSIGTSTTNIPTANPVSWWYFVTQATASAFTRVDIDYTYRRIAGLAR